MPRIVEQKLEEIVNNSKTIVDRLDTIAVYMYNLAQFLQRDETENSESLWEEEKGYNPTQPDHEMDTFP